MAAVTGIGRADRLSSQDEAALYERHAGRIFGYCLSRLGRREDAEDATQLTFLHAVSGLRRGVVPEAESAWLFGIARNVCLSRWASAGRRGRVEAACDPSELERLPHAHDPGRDELIGLESALELLPEQQRRAVLLRDWRGLSYEEIADRLGVSHAAVETLIFRGRAALAAQLGEQQGERRRRGRSLSGLWSLLDAVRGAFTGAAAGAKLAVAVGATIAVSGGGIALGTTLTPEPAAKPASGETAAHGANRESAASLRPASPMAVISPSHTLASAGDPGRGRAPDGRRGADAVATVGTPFEVEGSPAGKVPAPAPADTSPLDALSTDVPAPNVDTLPRTEAIVAATEPVIAVVSETLRSTPLPILPSVEVPKADIPAVGIPVAETPKVEIPNLEVPAVAPSAPLPTQPPAPTLPAAPAAPSLP